MTTDFTYGGKQILSSGPFKPNGKDMPSDARTRVESYADIASIPNPHVGLKITVKVDETNNNKMTDYIVKSLKANSMGFADSVIDEVVRYVDYLGVSAGGGSGEGLTPEQTQQLQTAYNHSQSPHVQQSDIPTKTSDLTNDSSFVTSTELTNAINVYQTIQDDTLTTTDKTVAGAINEVKNTVNLNSENISELSSQLDTIANKSITVETLERVTKEEIERQIQDGTIANLTLADNSIENNKYKDKSVSLNKLNGDVVGFNYLLDKTEPSALFRFTVSKRFNNIATLKFKIKPLIDFKLIVRLGYTGSVVDKRLSLKSGEETYFEFSYSTPTPNITFNAFTIGVNDNKATARIYCEIKDIDFTLDGESSPYQLPIEEGFSKIEQKGFILASKKYVTEEINKLNISDKLDRNELINKTAKGYRVNIRQTSYGTGIAFKFNDGNDIKYVAGDKITLNYRCRYQSFSDDGYAVLYNASNSGIASFGPFKNTTKNNTAIGELRLYNDTRTPTGTGYINDLRFNVYKNLDFEIQDIYVKINDKVYYPKSLSYPETTIVEEIPLVLDDNSIATKSFVEDLIGGIHKPDFELPFVNNIYTVKSSKNFFGVPIFLDYLYGKFKGTDRIIFDTDNDRRYVYPLRSLKNNKSMINTKVNYKVKSETLNVPNVKFNHICIDENLNTDNIRLLTIGDSVTAGAITKQQYWSVCAEYFAKEDIIKNRDSKFMCLGSNNFRTTTVEFNGKTKEVKAGACGISSWSLNSWLTNVSDTTNYDNPGGLNGFTYVDNGVTKFSILKWIERFRNYDDDGNKLELGNGTGTWINANNINKIKCCTPNVIYINSTHNGGTIEQHEEIINIIKQELPNCKVIIGNPMPLLGTYYPDRYVDEWIDDYMLRQLPNYGGEGDYLSSRLKSLRYYVQKEKEDTTNSFYFMPQIVITPTVEGYEYDLVDNGFKQMKKIVGEQLLPKEHPGTLAHKIWGYELYALLKYISGVEQGVTNNFDEVPLFDMNNTTS